MPGNYQKIVSLVPSLTELIMEFGLKSSLAGRTRFCVELADEVEDIPIVGGTKNPRLDKIEEIDPDLVIANKEENRKEDISYLQQLTEVELTDIRSVEDAMITIHQLGSRLEVPEQANQLNSRINTLIEQRPDEKPLQTIYLIWREPWMSVGHDTYIHDVMQQWNLTNATGYAARYPTLTLGEMQNLQPELILLSSEPFPFKEKHIDEIAPHFPDTRILTVNGRWFSWYGSRMTHSFEKLNTWRKAIS